MFILLDIDGVMVPAAGWKPVQLLSDGFSDFSAKAVKSLNRILAETNATLLLTTSHKSSYSISDWVNIFRRRGIVSNAIEALPENTGNLSRKDEVLNWIRSGKESSFVILDDDKSLNDLENHLKEKLILTQPLIGLQDKHAEEAITILIGSNFQP